MQGNHSTKMDLETPLLTTQPAFCVVFTMPGNVGINTYLCDVLKRQYRHLYDDGAVSVVFDVQQITVLTESISTSDCEYLADNVESFIWKLAREDASCPQEIRDLIPKPIVYDNSLILAKKARVLANKLK